MAWRHTLFQVLKVHPLHLLPEIPAVLIVEPDAAQHHGGDIGYQEDASRRPQLRPGERLPMLRMVLLHHRADIRLL